MPREWIASSSTAAEGSGSSPLSTVLSIAVFIGLMLVIRWAARFARGRSDLQNRLTNRSVLWWMCFGLCVGLALSAVAAVSLVLAGMPTEDDELSLTEFLFISVVPVTIVMSVCFGLMGWMTNRGQPR